jgi:hypothetical protein
MSEQLQEIRNTIQAMMESRSHSCASAPATNPLQIIHDQLWEMLESKADFCAAVSAGNRVKYGMAGPDPDLDNAITADYPRVRVYPGSDWKPNIMASSTSSQLSTLWEIQVCTGEQQLGAFWTVYWATYRACSGWQQYIQQDASWNGKLFVASVKPLRSDAHEPLRPPGWPVERKMNRGIRQWLTVWAAMVDCWFLTSDIQGT